MSRDARGVALFAQAVADAKGGAYAGADAAAARLVDALVELYGLPGWDMRGFVDAFASRVLAAWSPGTAIRTEGDSVRVETPLCPIASAVARDPRLCASCLRVKEAVAARAAGPGGEVTTESLVTRGDGACTLRVTTRAARP